MSLSEAKTCDVLQDLYSALLSLEEKPETGESFKIVRKMQNVFYCSLISYYPADELCLPVGLPAPQYLHRHQHYLHGKI